MAVDLNPAQSPPAVIQAMGATAGPLRTVQIPLSLDDKARVNSIQELVGCANFETPHRGAKILSVSPERAKKAEALGHECLSVIDNAVRAGWISDLPAAALALRSVPLVEPGTGIDNVALMAAYIRSSIIAHENSLGFNFKDPDLPNEGIVNSPFTSAEINAITINDARDREATMTPQRGIPVDPSTAFAMTAADVVIHPQHYTSPGKTLGESVAEARTRHPEAEDDKLAVLCQLNDGNLTTKDCQGVAARRYGDAVARGLAKPYNKNLYVIPVEHVAPGEAGYVPEKIYDRLVNCSAVVRLRWVHFASSSGKASPQSDEFMNRYFQLQANAKRLGIDAGIPEKTTEEEIERRSDFAWQRSTEAYRESCIHEFDAANQAIDRWRLTHPKP